MALPHVAALLWVSSEYGSVELLLIGELLAVSNSRGILVEEGAVVLVAIFRVKFLTRRAV